jgi:hypothetical protein
MTPPNIERHARSLVGTSTFTLTDERENRILSIDGQTLVVATDKSPQGERVPIEDLRSGAARLFGDGEVRVNVAELGRRSSFVGALLATLPNVETLTDPVRLRVRRPLPTAEIERTRRRQLWDALRSENPDRADVLAQDVRAVGIYNTGRGIFADLKRTRETTGDPRGATVSVRHTGRHYPDDLSDLGLAYHYPETKNASTDVMEVNATKAAGELGLPIFVILEGKRDRWRQVRPAWVTGWDDEAALFRLQFGTLDAPLPSLTIAPPELRADPLQHFQPKDASDYRARILGQEIIKTRHHEQLIRDYGEWAQDQGFRASTSEHPKDLVLRSDEREWLIEGKVVRQGKSTQAVREALSQLLMYRAFLNHQQAPGLVALFSEPVGEAYVRFLEDLSIGSVWRSGDRWMGSESILQQGLAHTPS